MVARPHFGPWLWIPRLVAALVAVHVYPIYGTLWRHGRGRAQVGDIPGSGGK